MPSQTFTPGEKPKPVCKKGEFVFAAAELDHGHIYGQCAGLVGAGGEIRYVYDPDPKKVEGIVNSYPGVKVVDRVETILDDPEVKLVASAGVPNVRGALGLRVMDAGKDYFVDKAPFTELEQLEAARKKVAETGRKHFVYYSERLNSECAVFAGELIHAGVIGRVIQVLGLGPHQLRAPSRPAWFFEKKKYGGILADIGSHQIEQFLYYSGAKDARITSASIANYNHPDYPELDDFGDATLIGDNGASNYFRVDWFTPDGLGTWGDGRAVILGTKGYIELRKVIDIGHDKAGEHLYIVTNDTTEHLSLNGKVGYPFFGQMILDSLNRTETAMPQAHAFKAAELCLKAQLAATRIE